MASEALAVSTSCSAPLFAADVERGQRRAFYRSLYYDAALFLV
jgi:hypothetical protein